MQVTYVNHYLTDTDVANFARQSFGRLAEQFTPEQNANLVRFLARGVDAATWEKMIDQLLDFGKVDYGAPEDSPMEIKNREEAKEFASYLRSIPEHWVPFGHPHISVRVSAPVPIARQLFKHKIGLVESEQSRRYIKSTPTVFIPQHFRAAAANAKQGSGGTHHLSTAWKLKYEAAVKKAVKLYEEMIQGGVCPEQARFVLPQGTEVEWVWTGSLYAFANVYVQRSNSHAQQESQMIAEELDKIIDPLFPVSWPALTRGHY